MSSSPGESPTQHHQHRVSHLVESVFAYDSNVMLAALISLLLVILFVLLLHVYAKWFLVQAQTQASRRRRTTSVAVSRVLNNLPPSSTFVLDLAPLSTSTASKGLEASTISAIPLFVHDGDGKSGLECVICLSGFDLGEVGRHLPKCGHEFHLECIDMWLGSHSNCPICRAPVVSDTVAGDGTTSEAVPGDGDSVVVVDVPSSGNDNGESSVGNDSSSSPLSSPSSSSFGCSLKRMLSRNRSENKVFPTASVSELATA